jgi:hypothetical protein
MDVYELAMWVWLASLVVVFVGWYVGTAIQAWLNRNRPNRFTQHDWVAERHRKVTRRAFKTRAGIDRQERTR